MSKIIEENKVEENKMGVMPMNKLLMNMALPMIISMLVQALYNVVDSVFVARIEDVGEVAEGLKASTAALNAVGMAFPFQTLLIAFGTGTAVGVNALLSKALGEKNQETVNKAANNGIFLSICNAILFLLIGLFLAPTLIKSQGATGLTLKYGSEYLSTVCIFSFGIYMQFIFERLLQSTGRSVYSMISQMSGAIINIVLDPILIFGMFGFPALKVQGAAIATVTGQIIAAIIAIVLNLKLNKDIKISLIGFKPDFKIIKRIYEVAIPTIVMQSIGSIMTYSMNKLLTNLNPASVAVFTVYFKLQSMFFMPIFGLNNGMVPILAFNYGAQKRSRMYRVIKLSMAYAFAFMFVGFLLFEFAPDKLLLIFNTGEESLLQLGVPALKIIGVHYLVAWFCIISGTVFQALGNGWYSLVVSVCRQLVVLIPVAYLLGKLFGLPTVWWCFPIAEVMSLIVTLIFLFKINRNVISKVEDRV